MTIAPGLVLLERYRLDSRLAQNQVETWKAQCLEDQRWVVVKILPISQLSDWKTQELFEREARALQNLKHPALPSYLDYGYETPHAFYYLVHTWVEGQSLQQCLDRGESFSEPQLREWAAQILAILSYLHGFSPPIVHRDLKPSNLIWDGTNIALVDFGGVLDVLNPQGGSTVIGTYGYMAPEQFAGKAGPGSDLYSVGATLIHLLTGQLPSELLNAQLEWVLPNYLPISPHFRLWLAQLTAYSPVERFQSAEAALARLQAQDSPLILSSSNIPPPAGTAVRLEHRSSLLEISFEEPYFTVARLMLSSFAFLIGWTMIAALTASVFPAFNGTPAYMFIFMPPIFLIFGILFLAMASTLEFLAQWIYFGTELTFRAEGSFVLKKTLFWRGKAKWVPLLETGPIDSIQALQKPLAYYQNRDAIYKLRLDVGTFKYDFANALSESEQDWLQAEILAYLSRHQTPTEQQLFKARSGV